MIFDTCQVLIDSDLSFDLSGFFLFFRVTIRVRVRWSGWSGGHNTDTPVVPRSDRVNYFC